MLTRNSNTRPFQLRGDAGQAPFWTPGATLQFNLNNLPILTDGNKANFMVGIELTAFGLVESDAAVPQPILQVDLCRGLFQSFELQSAWHGRPVSAQHVRGATLPIIERIACGYQAPARQIVVDSQNEAAVGFRFSQLIPLGHFLGDDPQYQAQLAALFTNAEFLINCSAANPFTDSNGNALTFDVAGAGAVQVMASAVLIPERALRLASGSEWIEFQQTASDNNDEVTLDSLGNQTALEGVEPGAGIDTMLALCDQRGQLGAFKLDTVTQVSAPLAGITQTKHIDPFMHMLEQASTEGGRPIEGTVVDDANAFVGVVRDGSAFPYTQAGQGRTGSGLDQQALCLPILVAGASLQVSKVRVFEGTGVYYRTLSAAPTQARDRTLIHQYKSWSPAKVEDHRQLMISTGLAKAVLGTNDIMPRAAVNDLAPANPAKARFFPIEWVPAVKPAT